MKVLLSSIVAILCISQVSAQQLHEPSFEEILSIRNIGTSIISPNGKHVLFTKSQVDWDKNRYDNEIWISKNGSAPFQLTNNTNGSSGSPSWSPDGKWISFTSNRGSGNQVYVMSIDGGAPFQVTHSEDGVFNYEWTPDGKHITYLETEDRSEETDKVEDKYGAFAEDDAEYSIDVLWSQPFHPEHLGDMMLPAQMEDSTFKAQFKAHQVIEDQDFSINGYEWSPDGKYILFDHQPNNLLLSFFDSDVSLFDVEAKKLTTVVENASSDAMVGWSPDGEHFILSTNLDDRESNFYKNNSYFIVSRDGSDMKPLAKDYDEYLSFVEWKKDGIYAIAWNKTKRDLLKINPKSGKIDVIDTGFDRVFGTSISDDSKTFAVRGNTDNSLTEIVLTDAKFKKRNQITNASNQIENWAVSDAEMIQWESKDGSIIEGVLNKPMNYDPNKKYPLLVVIHGGPTGIDYPTPTHGYVYPVNQWLNKGALVLEPNYRGSAGYGEDFRSLNVDNLGVGDMWDVESGVQYLIDQGLVDADKVGAMGWSQGGYISAFLSTNSSMFKALSVGAGISNWMTYYVNTDIHPFTRQYLNSTPWSNKELYEKTSPMTNINDAVTPTLIQHGEFDRRVPTPNAYELYQGLQDVGVDSKLIIYKGFGHGISKPKERLAAVWHNWQWFGKYIWDEDIEMPK